MVGHDATAKGTAPMHSFHGEAHYRSKSICLLCIFHTLKFFFLLLDTTLAFNEQEKRFKQ